MKVLITGACGFIGFHYSLFLLNKGFNICGVDDLNNYYSVSLKKERLNILRKNKKFKFHKISTHNFKKMEYIFKKNKFDLIINFAAQAGVRLSFLNQDVYFNRNIVGFYNILKLCKIYKIKKVIYASSSSVYGNSKSKKFSLNDKSDNQESFYAATKKINEIIANTYSKKFKINIIGLRFFTVYGPYGRPDMAYFKFTDKLFKNKSIELYNSGNHSRDFTYIEDAVKMIFQIQKSKKKISHQIYNIAAGKNEKLLKLINVIEKLSGKKFKIKKLKKQVGDVDDTHADISLTKKTTRYSPKYNLNLGMKKFIDWYKSRS